MQKNLYLIDYENAHWCGGQMNVVVSAESEDEAHYLAEGHMEEAQRELFADHYIDCEEGEDEECPYIINSITLFDEKHDEWKFFKDPTQAEFYPLIGEGYKW